MPGNGSMSCFIVTIAIPIKRGLKANTARSSARALGVTIAIPIKRGLKVLNHSGCAFTAQVLQLLSRLKGD